MFRPIAKRTAAAAASTKCHPDFVAEIRAQQARLQEEFAAVQQKFLADMQALEDRAAAAALVEKSSSSPKRTKLSSSPPEITLHFDGASKGNPGEGGGGWVASTPHRTLAFGWNHLAQCTNNEAEYLGLISALKFVTSRLMSSSSSSSPTPTTMIHIKGDSTIVVKQVLGKFRCHAVNLQPLCKQASDLYAALAEEHPISLSWIPREQNGVADKLSNLAISQRGDCVFEMPQQEEDGVLVDESYLAQRFSAQTTTHQLV